MSKLLQKLFDTIAEQPAVMLSLNKNGDHSEPMQSFTIDGDLKHLWFFTNKNNRIAGGGKTTGVYSNGDEQFYASIIGQLKLEKREEVVQNLYSPQVGAFFEHGILDDNLVLLRLDIETVEIWQQHLDAMNKFKMMAGVKIDENDIQEHEVIKV